MTDEKDEKAVEPIDDQTHNIEDAVVTFDDLGSAVSNLSQILDLIEKGEGSLGQLVTKDDLHQSLEQTNKQIQLLLEDMRLNPKRYVHFSLFGKKQVKYKPSDLQTE